MRLFFILLLNWSFVQLTAFRFSTGWISRGFQLKSNKARFPALASSTDFRSPEVESKFNASKFFKTVYEENNKEYTTASNFSKLPFQLNTIFRCWETQLNQTGGLGQFNLKKLSFMSYGNNGIYWYSFLFFNGKILQIRLDDACCLHPPCRSLSCFDSSLPAVDNELNIGQYEMTDIVRFAKSFLQCSDVVITYSYSLAFSRFEINLFDANDNRRGVVVSYERYLEDYLDPRRQKCWRKPYSGSLRDSKSILANVDNIFDSFETQFNTLKFNLKKLTAGSRRHLGMKYYHKGIECTADLFSKLDAEKKETLIIKLEADKYSFPPLCTDKNNSDFKIVASRLEGFKKFASKFLKCQQIVVQVFYSVDYSLEFRAYNAKDSRKAVVLSFQKILDYELREQHYDEMI